MLDPIQTLMLGVQTLALAGLIWYALETHWMRQAAQEQIRISQNLINAAMDQVEGLSKPCLTLKSRLRDAQDTILDMNGAVGSTQAAGDQGNFALQNIGNGVALNVSYRFEHVHPIDAPPRPYRTRYVQNVLTNQSVAMVETLTAYTGTFELTFNYESLGGRKYQTIVRLNNHVLTGFNFEQRSLAGGTVG
jgi:hypothetical protein